MAEVKIIDGASDREIAAWLHARLSDALRGEAPVAITVPGGSTPFPILSALAEEPLDWGRVTVWPGDDRLVPEDHPASNTGRIRALLAPVGAEVVTLTTMEQAPHFTLAWLGMGNDGHVASLVPTTDPRIDAARSFRRLTPDSLPPQAPFVPTTLPLLALRDRDT